MRRIILSMAYPLLSNFFTLPQNGTIFVKTLLNKQKRVLIFSTTFF